MPPAPKIVIVGSGPSGIATAAALIQTRPHWAEHITILEKAVHPRQKLCGGGITPWADDRLTDLNLSVDVPTFRVDKVAFYFNDTPLFFNYQGLMRTVRRDEFDAALVDRIRVLGVEVRDGEAVRDIEVRADGVIVQSTRAAYQADVVVGADGAKGIVRRLLFRDEESRVSRLMEVLVPVPDANSDEFKQRMAVFDFRQVPNALQGYLWDFPSLIDGTPHLNIGIFDSRVRSGPRANLRQMLAARLRQRGLEASDITYMGHPERWYHPAKRYSRPRVLLVGDAAGIEPWLGEGISVALNYGPVAAKTICRAADADDFSLKGYAREINRTRLGWTLRRNRIIARYFYRRRLNWTLPLLGKFLSWNFGKNPPHRPQEQPLAPAGNSVQKI